MSLPGRLLARVRPMTAFRAFFGFWLLAVPWLWGQGLDAWGLQETLVGLSVVATAPSCESRPSLRLGQSFLGLWLMVAPFVFDVGLFLTFSDILVGKTLLISGLIASEIFAPEKPAPEASTHAQEIT